MQSPVTGPDGAPTIVFLHGGGVGGWMWEPVVRSLPTYHCLTPDAPGHGSNRSLARFSFDDGAIHVAQLIRERATGGKAIVVGLSAGAQMAVQLLATAPEVVERAIVSSALVRPVAGLAWASKPTVLAWSYRLTVAPLQQSDWWIRLNMKYAAGIPGTFFQEFKHDFGSLTESEFIDMMVANQTFRIPPGLSGAMAPTLVLAGVREAVAMRESVLDIASALPNGVAAVLNLGARASRVAEHNWALSAPELFARTTAAWIEGERLPPQITTI